MLNQYRLVIYFLVTESDDAKMDLREKRRRNLGILMDREFGNARGAQTRLAEKLDKPQNFISRCLAEPGKAGAKTIGEDFAREIEDAFQLERYALDGELAPPIEDREVAKRVADYAAHAGIKKTSNDCEISIPQFDVRAAMGSGQLPNDYVEIIRHVTIHKSHLDLLGIAYTSPANLAIITGWGQSMAGTINHGEPVFVDRGITQFIGDGVYVFTWDDLVYIKRVQKVSKTHFRIISDNREHDPFEVLIADVVFHAQALLAWNAKKL